MIMFTVSLDFLVAIIQIFICLKAVKVVWVPIYHLRLDISFQVWTARDQLCSNLFWTTLQTTGRAHSNGFLLHRDSSTRTCHIAANFSP